jgi:tRNA pseudouridine55 synthase
MSSKRSGPNPLHGILLIDKPAGWTSHDVVARVRRLTGQRKMGHTGTLDPMATGLLVLCLGDATRLVEYMSGHEKRYEGAITLGVTTATDDAEGGILQARPVPPFDEAELEMALDRFRGEITQRPPAYSAVKIDGRRAYAIARSGETPRIASRQVTIHEFTARRIAEDRLSIVVRCSAGTYIRSLARDLGELLGCGAHLSSLRRTHAGRFAVEDAVTLETIEQAGTMHAEYLLIAPDEDLMEWPAAVIGPHGIESFLHGASSDCSSWRLQSEASYPLVRVFSTDGEFAGMGALNAIGKLRPIKVMAHLLG